MVLGRVSLYSHLCVVTKMVNVLEIIPEWHQKAFIFIIVSVLA